MLKGNSESPGLLLTWRDSLTRLRVTWQPQHAKRDAYFVAMTAISIFTSRGKRATSTVARTGGLVLKYSP